MFFGGSDGGVLSNVGSSSGSSGNSGSSLLGNNIPQPPALPD